jgi:tyrosyl-tRNA synthetase
LDVDIEVGGNDQTFNMLAGRTLMKELKNKEKFVVTSALLADSSGKKMGKTEGNMIALSDAPEDMFGKVMSWTDGMIVLGYKLCTDASEEEVALIEAGIKAGENPMTFKRELGKRIVAWLCGEDAAERAAAQFSAVHQKGERPDEIPELKVKGSMNVVDALVASELCSSKSDARRQIEQGGVKVDDEVVKDVTATVSKGSVIQKGKRHFVKLV